MFVEISETHHIAHFHAYYQEHTAVMFHSTCRDDRRVVPKLEWPELGDLWKRRPNKMLKLKAKVLITHAPNGLGQEISQRQQLGELPLAAALNSEDRNG